MNLIKKLYSKIDKLGDALAIPREHFLNIDKLSAEEVLQ